MSNNRVLSRFQEGFVRNKSMIYSIFIIITTGARYLRSIQGCIWWCLLNLQKACDPINRGALWYKLHRKGLIIGLVECIKGMFEDIEFCERWKNDQVPELIPQEIGVRQVCSLSLYLFNTGIDDVHGWSENFCLDHKWQHYRQDFFFSLSWYICHKHSCEITSHSIK